MKPRLRICAILLSMLYANISNAEWSFGEFGNTDNGYGFKTIKILDNNEQTIEYKGKSCVISETLFNRVSKSHISEFRKIECLASNDITIIDLVTCREGLIEINSASIKINGQYFQPLLKCDLTK